MLLACGGKRVFRNSASLTVTVLYFCFTSLLSIDVGIWYSNAMVLRWQDKRKSRSGAEIDNTLQLVLLGRVIRSNFCRAEPRSRYSTSLSPCLPTVCFMQDLRSVMVQPGTLG